MFKFIGGVKNGKWLPVEFQWSDLYGMPLLPEIVEVPAAPLDEIRNAIDGALPLGDICIEKHSYTKRECKSESGARVVFYAMQHMSDQEALVDFLESNIEEAKE